MAAGQGFKTFTSGDVLTAADVNGYLMQGVGVFADATERDAEITSPEEGQFAYLKDTNATTYYTGSAWVGIGASPLTTKGDVYTYSTTDDRIGVGANDTVLTADSSTATGLKWATVSGGGMTLISTTSLTGAGTINITSIPATYNNLQLVIQNMKPANDGEYFSVRLNNDSGANRYRAILPTNMSQGNFAYDNASFVTINRNDNSVATGLTILDIPNYANTTTTKLATVISVGNNPTTTTQAEIGVFYLYYNQTAAISEINLFLGAGNFTSGTALLYGVK
jgi:hypothetical protein